MSGSSLCLLWTCGLFSQQFTAEMVANACEQMDARCGTGNCMGLARVKQKVKLLSGLNKGVDHLHRILHMNVVVAGAMHFQQVSMKLFGEADGGTLFVRLFKFRDQTCVTFCVDAVIVMPVG